MQSKPFFGAEIAPKATCSDANHTSTPKNVKLHHSAWNRTKLVQKLSDHKLLLTDRVALELGLKVNPIKVNCFSR